jgi:hypothetical protein
MVGATPMQGILLENFENLYTNFRARKLRVDFANVNLLPAETVRKALDEATKTFGKATGGILGESHLLTASDMADSNLNDAEYKRLQGMLGGSNAKGTKVLAKLRGVTEKLEGFETNATVVVMDCEDCTVELASTCVKVYMQNCKNLRLLLAAKVITHTLECYQCDGCIVNIETKIWTAQMDLCRNAKLNWARREDFQTVISAGCHVLDVHLQDLTEAIGTETIHFPALQAAAEDAASISEEHTQWKTHFKSGKLCTKQVRC